jgi:transcriptional activator protein UGA3
MAMESKALADSIVSWASGHLATVDDSYALVALETHSSAISALSSSITSPHYDLALHETNAAACLVLLISEVCRGDREIWYSHLQGAKSIISSAQSGDKYGVDAFKLSDEGQWVLRNFAYHDILASVTLSRPPLLNGAYLDGITDVVDSCVGVATSILKILADICALEHELNTSVLSDSDASEKFQDLDTRLTEWSCTADTSQDLACIAYAYRNAAQIVLFRACGHASSVDYCLPPEFDDHLCRDNISFAVESLLDAIGAIPVGSLAESALVFPLFIAGGEAMTSEQQDIIRMRLQSTLEQRQFQNITRALQILEDLWQRRRTDTTADWKDVLAESGGGLILT